MSQISIFLDPLSHVLNPTDPNPAISAHVVHPQSGHIRPEKGPFPKKFQYFSKLYI